MPRIWIVNPFDPLPGDPEQPGRYASLARMLRGMGHEVTWWSAGFSHRFKRPLDREPIEAACRREQIGLRLIDVPPYERNVCLQRILSHRAYARGFAEQAVTEPPPAVIIASNPPLEAPLAAGRFARSCDAKLIVDVQDIWVDNFRLLMPAALRWASSILLGPCVRTNRKAYALADAVVGVAAGYADEPKRYGRPDYRREEIPIGIDLAAFDEAVARGRCLLPHKQPGETWIVYSGSYSHGYDVLTIARAAARVLKQRPDVRFIFSGRGELEPRVREILAGSDRVTFLGFAPFEDWAATVSRCDIGWNAIRPEALVLMPNKIFYYWAAGLAILNSNPGECAEWVRSTDTGISYRGKNVDAAVAALLVLLQDPAGIARRREASRRAAVERWDRRRLYLPYLGLVADLCK